MSFQIAKFELAEVLKSSHPASKISLTNHKQGPDLVQPGEPLSKKTVKPVFFYCDIMKLMSNYKNIRFIGGVAALAGGATALAFGLRGDTTYLVLGIISIALGASLMFTLSKKK